MMNSSNSAFFDEIYLLSETDCKSTKVSNDNSTYNGIDIFTEEDPEGWSQNERGMLEKIISLCGFQFEDCRLIHLKLLNQISQSLQNDEVCYIIIFAGKAKLNDLHFRPKKFDWVKLNTKKIYVNSVISEFATDNIAKGKFWKALQSEFEHARNYKG